MSPDLRAIYNEDMRAALEDKLFFLPHVEQHTSTYVDFGCGDGALLAECLARSSRPSPRAIGIDAAPQFHVASPMVHFAVGGPGRLAEGWLRDGGLGGGDTTLILSSVLHEVVSEHGRLDVLPVSSLRPRFIAIRDMCWPDTAGVSSCLSEGDISRLRAMGSDPQWSSFQNVWGRITTWEQAAHWVLKVPYAANWAHENREDYLCVKRTALLEWVSWLGYRVIHRRVFTPPPVVARCIEARVGLPWHTHIELVAELCP